MKLKEKIQKFKKYYRKIRPYKKKPKNQSNMVWKKIKKNKNYDLV